MTSTRVDDVELAKPQRSTITWEAVSYSVGRAPKEKSILTAVDGCLEGGSLCAIIGPSGAGKSSLLNILAGRVRSRGGKCRVGGRILLDGQPIHGAALRKRIAYVLQEDFLMATTTPREAIFFSAQLRLPRSVSVEEKRQLVESMLRELGLEGCADTRIGNHLMRGVSGGEKKRTSIGVELVMKPRLVFLDEPTSGLDSFAAHAVIVKMRALAHQQGCNVLSTIHQPSSEAFHSFDKVTLLQAGKVFYFGEIGGFARQLEKAGHGCPSGYNLADHALYLVQTLPEDKLDQLRATLASPIPKPEPTAEASLDRVEGGAGFGVQLFALSLREARDVRRNTAGAIAGLLVPACLTTIYGCVFYQVGDVGRDDYNPRSHFGGMTILAISGMFGSAQPLLFKFPLDRGIFLREYATATYATAPYFLSKTMVELPQSFTVALIVVFIGYFMMHLQGNFILLVLVYWLSGIAAASSALLLGCAASNAEVAAQASSAVFVPQLLYAGFYIPVEQIPVWMRWVQYICSLKYAMNLFILIEFGSDKVNSWSPEQQEFASETIETNDVAPNDWYIYVIILLAIISCFRGLSTFLLARRAAAFF
mmetsp:Transcript_9863/g.24408  ORF Transcript_9863/g.24408 Transcript_9863/m.24408 type:complete len:592 (+) Transcript_9863:152-1927(+)